MIEIVDKLPATGRVDMFPTTHASNFIATTHVETVALLERNIKNEK